MTETDRPAFMEAMLRLAGTFGTALSEFQFDGYWEGLEDLRLDRVERAMWSAVRQCEFFPRVATLRELADPCRYVPGDGPAPPTGISQASGVLAIEDGRTPAQRAAQREQERAEFGVLLHAVVEHMGAAVAKRQASAQMTPEQVEARKAILREQARFLGTRDD